MGFSGDSMVKNLPASAGTTGDVGSIPGSGRSPGEGNGNPLQYACLENPMDRGACWATVHGVAKIWARLSDWNWSHGEHRWEREAILDVSSGSGVKRSGLGEIGKEYWKEGAMEEKGKPGDSGIWEGKWERSIKSLVSICQMNERSV